jgi:hypothetical protein
LVLAMYIFIRNPRSEISISFIFLIFSFVLWALAQAILYSTSDRATAVLVDRSSYVFALLIPWSFLSFLLVFPYRMRDTNNILRYINIFLSIVCLGLLFFPNLYTYDVNITHFKKDLLINYYSFTFWVVTYLLIMLHAFIIFYKKYRIAAGESKQQLRYIMGATIIPIIAGSLMNLFLYFLNIYDFAVYGPSFTLIFTVTVSYLIFLRPRRI